MTTNKLTKFMDKRTTKTKKIKNKLKISNKNGKGKGKNNKTAHSRKRSLKKTNSPTFSLRKMINSFFK